MRRLLFVLLFLVACKRGEEAAPAAPSIGNAERGRQLATQYGCNVCHIIPGVEGPQGALGPSLQGVASRPTISQGAVQNIPANLVAFIRNPQSLNPQSAMPPMNIAEADAKDLAAYVLTLK